MSLSPAPEDQLNLGSPSATHIGHVSRNSQGSRSDNAYVVNKPHRSATVVFHCEHGLGQVTSPEESGTIGPTCHDAAFQRRQR